MYITLETDYAIRIVDYLSGTTELRCAKEISEAVSVPLRFARNILQKLVGKDIVISYKGVNGGYKLAKAPKVISLYDVFRAMDEPVILNRCLKAEYECSCCPDKQCAYYSIFMQISNEMENQLRNTRFTPGAVSRIQFGQ